MSLTNKMYLSWKFDGYYVYLLENGTGKDFYIGITSNPERRLNQHNARQTIPGKLRYSRIHYAGSLWKALTLEAELHRLQEANDRYGICSVMHTVESFTSWALKLPSRVPSAVNMRLPYLRQIGIL